jgi:Fe-S-cluster containining protein
MRMRRSVATVFARRTRAYDLGVSSDRGSQPPLHAGDFASWATATARAIRDNSTIDVPCDHCTACCRSAQFVHVEPDEADALAHIPPALLFPAPHRPAGHQVLGYDEHGHCPMLVDDRCSIYEHRPRACHTYDCRVFAATDISITDKPLIAARVAQWRFEFTSPRDNRTLAAVRAAARQVETAGEIQNPTQQAAAAVEMYERFLGEELEQ